MKIVYLTVFLVAQLTFSCREDSSQSTSQTSKAVPTQDIDEQQTSEQELEEWLKKAQKSIIDRDFHGTLEKSGQRSLLSIFFKENQIQCYSKIARKPERRIHLRCNDKQASILEINEGKTRKLDASEIQNSISGSDLTIADLYWLSLQGRHSISYQGDENIAGFKCSKVRIIHGDHISAYKISYIWISKKQLIPLQIIGYNADGKALKKIICTDLSRDNENHFNIKRLRIESFHPDQNISQGVTYLSIGMHKK